MSQLERPRLTIAQWEDFQTFPAWLEIEEYLGSRLETLRDGLETHSDHKDIIADQAEAFAIRYLLELPEKLIADLRVDQLKEEEQDGEVESTTGD